MVQNNVCMCVSARRICAMEYFCLMKRAFKAMWTHACKTCTNINTNTQRHTHTHRTFEPTQWKQPCVLRRWSVAQDLDLPHCQLALAWTWLNALRRQAKWRAQAAAFFYFSSLITTSTHCDCAENAACRLAPRQSSPSSLRGGFGDERPWGDEKRIAEQRLPFIFRAGLPACLPACPPVAHLPYSRLCCDFCENELAWVRCW